MCVQMGGIGDKCGGVPIVIVERLSLQGDDRSGGRGALTDHSSLNFQVVISVVLSDIISLIKKCCHNLHIPLVFSIVDTF